MKAPSKTFTSRLKQVLNGALALATLLTVFFLPLAIAVILIAALLYYWVLAWRLPEPDNAADFTFTTTELDTFEALGPREKSTQQALSALWKQGSHLSKRKDGYFSERSKLGKRLNPDIQLLEAELGEDRKFVVQYGSFADERKRHYVRVKSRRLAATLATLVYGLVTGLLLHMPNSLTEKLSQAINHMGLLPPPPALPNLWGAIAVAAVATIVIFVPLKALSNFVTRLRLNLGTAMNARDAIAFSGRYAAHSGIGDA